MSTVGVRDKKAILYSSSCASVISTVVTNPLQVLRIRTQYFLDSCRHAELICMCSKTTISKSISTLRVALPQITISNIIWMQLYEHTRQFLVSKQMSDSWATLLGSMIARGVVSSITLPMEAFRIKSTNSDMAVLNHHLQPSFGTTQSTTVSYQLANRFSLRGLMTQSLQIIGAHGWKVTLMRDLVQSGLFWTLMEKSRNALHGGNYRTAFNTIDTNTLLWTNIVASLLSATISSALTNPLDALKTRIQTDSIARYSILKELVAMYRKDKFVSLFAGVNYRVLKNSLHSALYMIIFEYCQRHHFVKAE